MIGRRARPRPGSALVPYLALFALLGACSFESGPELAAPDAFAKAQAQAQAHELTVIDISPRAPNES